MEPLSEMSRRVPSLCMASITLWVPSRSTVVGPVPRGPNAA
jgi:hypothetical protein